MFVGGMIRPYARFPSSANHSNVSAACKTSSRASASGFPCSWVRRLRDPIGAIAHQFGGLLEDLGAIVNRRCSPLRKRLGIALNRPVRVVPPAISHFSQHRFVGGIDNCKRTPALGIAP